MNPSVLTPENSTVILVDYAVGFANVLRSHDLSAHINAVVGLARTATLYHSGLMVTNGPASKPSGPLYPQLLEVIGDHPVIERGGQFNAFLDDRFAAAVRATGRTNIIVAGVSTEGCVTQTALGGLREGYAVAVVVDASAGLTREAHETAVQRMIQAGIVPLTWFALASEYQADQSRPNAANRRRLMEEHVPELAGALHYYGAAQARAASRVA